MRLAVLGAGTPFAAGLVDALAAPGAPAPAELALHGRHQPMLELVAGYAARRLGPRGWRVRWSTDLGEALGGSTVVLHQPRYGGLEGRREDEALALRFGALPDETLGPGGLNAALRMVPELRHTARAIAGAAPDAVVVNLTNPLSVCTALLAGWCAQPCVGLCEQPRATAARAAAVLGVPMDRVEWSYAGLNHRGFVVRLASGGADLIAALGPALCGGALDGVPAAEIERLGAIPTPGFRLVRGWGTAPAAGRARELDGLRRRVAGELRARPGVQPPSLGLRAMPWYADSVAPFLAALQAALPGEHVVNLRGGDGVVREGAALVSRDGVVPLEPVPCTGEVGGWLRRFEAHERAVLQAVGDPTRGALCQALALDPLAPAAAVEPIADAINALRKLW
jgi:6-phospho-beta-glucosidase